MMKNRLKAIPEMAAFLLLPLFAGQSPAYGSNPSPCPELLSRAAVAAQVRQASRLTEEKIQAAL